MNDLKQNIAYANKHYAEHARQQAHAETQLQRAHSNEKEKLRDVKGRIKFE